MKAEIVYDIWLALAAGQSLALPRQLLEQFGSAKVLYENRMSLRETAVRLTGEERKAFETLSLARPERIAEQCERDGTRIVALPDEGYPERLREIYDPPAVLYLRGEIGAVDRQIALAVVGTRNHSEYGWRAAETLARGLASVGVVIVSGMARGIDTAAHKGALKGDGRTVAVLGSAIDNPYPRENRDLYEFIASNGAVLSEFAPGEPTRPQNFPRRNRVITGLSLGVLVVEAPERSGALISARHAAEQNRDVFAVPGRIDSPLSAGTNGLLKAGAKLVTEPLDVLSEYVGLYPQTIRAQTPKRRAVRFERPVWAERSPAGEEPPEKKKGLLRRRAERSTTKDLQLTREETIIKDALRAEPLTADELVERTGLTIDQVSIALTMLEVKNHVSKVGDCFTV